MAVKIRFIRSGSNTAIGGFASGDYAVVSEAFARHLVCEARVARYDEVTAPPVEQRQRRRKKQAA